MPFICIRGNDYCVSPLGLDEYISISMVNRLHHKFSVAVLNAAISTISIKELNLLSEDEITSVYDLYLEAVSSTLSYTPNSSTPTVDEIPTI